MGRWDSGARKASDRGATQRAMEGSEEPCKAFPCGREWCKAAVWLLDLASRHLVVGKWAVGCLASCRACPREPLVSHVVGKRSDIVGRRRVRTEAQQEHVRRTIARRLFCCYQHHQSFRASCIFLF